MIFIVTYIKGIHQAEAIYRNSRSPTHDSGRLLAVNMAGKRSVYCIIAEGSDGRWFDSMPAILA